MKFDTKLPEKLKDYLCDVLGVFLNESDYPDLSSLDKVDSLNLTNKYSDYIFDGKFLKKLKYLSIKGGNFYEINLSQNEILEELHIHGTSILEINLEKNVNLKKIVIKKNFIQSLDVSFCDKLEYLDCSHN